MRRYIKFIGFIFLFTFTIVKGAAMSTVLTHKPFFTLHFTVSGCAYDFRVNDVPIFSDPEGIYVSSAIPINEWMLSGKNTISLYLQPLKAAKEVVKEMQDCHVNLSLQVRESQTPDSNNQIISQIKYHSNPEVLSSKEKTLKGSTPAGDYSLSPSLKQDDEGDIQLGEITLTPNKGQYGLGVVIKRTLDLPKLPFPKWAWLSGETLKNDEATRTQLLKQYELFWMLINNKDFSQIKKKFTLRNKEYAEAFYRSPESMDATPEIKRDANNDKMELVKLIPKYMYLKIFGNGKLAKLTAWDGGDVIFFNYKKENLSESVGIIFSKINGKWEIVR